MVNRSDQETQGVQTPASKLARPEPPDAGQKRWRYSSPRPSQSINQPISTAFHGLLARTIQRWRTDPAFVVLSVAVALVLVSSLVLTVLVAHAVTTGNASPDWTPAMVEHPTMTVPAGPINLKPTFPTPVTGKGSSISSQPTGHSATSLQPTPTPDDNDQGSLDVQITNLPNVVNNRSQVQIDVQTSEPHVDIQLQVTYDVAPFYYTSRGNTTDGNGNATLNWNVRVRGLTNGSEAQAMVMVVATDQNGQQATSQPMTVEITQ